MTDAAEASRIEAEARARVVWPDGTPDQIARGEAALRAYFVAKGSTPFAARASANRLMSEWEFEEEFGPPAAVNDAPAQPCAPTAEEREAQLWWDAPGIAWRAIADGDATMLEAGEPAGFAVELDYDRAAWRVASGAAEDDEEYRRFLNLPEEERQRILAAEGLGDRAAAPPAANANCAGPPKRGLDPDSFGPLPY